MKKVLVVLLAALVLLTGCHRGSSEYEDASVTVPSTYVSYTLDAVSFRFEAGWQASSPDTVTASQSDFLSQLGLDGALAITGQMQSASTDKGTINYIDVGYFQTDHDTSAKELEGIMENINEIGGSLEKLDISSDQLQKSRIRCYGSDQTEALTFCYQLDSKVDSSDLTAQPVSCVIQGALIPHGSRVYVLLYSDFTSGRDDSSLEEMLTSLTFTDTTNQ